MSIVVAVPLAVAAMTDTVCDEGFDNWTVNTNGVAPALPSGWLTSVIEIAGQGCR